VKATEEVSRGGDVGRAGRGGAAYRPQLDSLRFFAILGVVIAHAWRPNILPWIFGGLGVGFLGVRLFFVLSGFLITTILLGCRDRAEQRDDRRSVLIRRFYARRFLRIYPLYYAVLAGLLIIGIWPTRAIWPWLASYTTNIYIWDHREWVGPSGIFWTLAVEEQFYLLWPLLVLFAPRRWLLPILTVAICLAPAFRLSAAISEPRDLASGAYTSGTFTLAVFDTLGVGALTALLFHADPTGRRLRPGLTRVALPLGAGVLCALLALAHYGVAVGTITFVVGETALGLVFAWLVASATWGFGGVVGRVLEWRPIAYLGKISYGIYIFHAFVPLGIVWVARRVGVTYTGSQGPLNFVLLSVVTVALAALSWRLFEGPINDLKRHFPYRDDAKAPAPPVRELAEISSP
jgi:peptidoglycan/LPS O-acetylase OafA/YrhL